MSHGRRSEPPARAVILALLIALLMVVPDPSGSSGAHAAPGARPAEFSLSAVRGAAWKGRFRLREHLGKRPIVIAFFATWCRPCEVELPILEKLRAQFPPEALAMVAVSVDGPESTARIAPLVRRLGLTFPVVHDADSSVSAKLNPQRTVPFLITVDARGRIVGERAGFSAEHQRSLPAQIAALVKQKR